MAQSPDAREADQGAALAAKAASISIQEGGPSSSSSSPGLASSGFPSSSPSSSRIATGGPPPRAATGGPSRRPPPGAGLNGIGGLSDINDRTRQLAGAKIPPSLQARLAANANLGASIGANQRLDPNSVLSSTRVAPPRPGFPAGIGGISTPAGVGAGAGAVSSGGPPSAGPIGGLGGRRNRPGLKLSDMGIGSDGTAKGPPGGLAMPPPGAGGPGAPGRRLAPPGRLAAASGGPMSSAFNNYSKIVDPSGRLNFGGKAILHASGVEFGNGVQFNINMDDLELLDELGRGNYGTVRKVRHTRTKVAMAMKEIRLELDDPKLKAIIMELDILHRATAPQIVEFYGAFFIEGCVYYCMEYMDAGSLDKLYYGEASVPEDVLARITNSMVKGLRFLKDDLNIIHRDVKPTNVLVNRKGEVKLCDFGVSGQLEKSLAKTNIGCQSYMAPERIKGESQNNLSTYTVASDVWSLGLSLVEVAKGGYPYPPETYSNVFAQLQAIVHGDPPTLPDAYSDVAQDFVAKCLEKVAERRATYAELLEHPFLQADVERGEKVDMEGWVKRTLEAKEKEKEKVKAASSADDALPAAAAAAGPTADGAGQTAQEQSPSDAIPATVVSAPPP